MNLQQLINEIPKFKKTKIQFVVQWWENYGDFREESFDTFQKAVKFVKNKQKYNNSSKYNIMIELVKVNELLEEQNLKGSIYE